MHMQVVYPAETVLPTLQELAGCFFMRSLSGREAAHPSQPLQLTLPEDAPSPPTRSDRDR